MNIDMLKEAMRRSGHTLGSLAEALDMQYQSVQYRNANNAWKAREVKKVAAVLNLTDEETKAIFL